MPAFPQFTVLNRPSDYVLPVALRAFQLLFSILTLITAAVSVSKYSFSREEATLAISVISTVYIIASFFVFHLVNALTVIISESILTILWLVAFALAADLWGSGSCSYSGFYYSFSSTGCRAGKASIAFAVLAWIFFVASLVLHIIYTLIPLSKTKEGIYFTRILTIGGIFYAPNEALATVDGEGVIAPVANATDLEAGLSAEPKDYHITEPEYHSEAAVLEPPVAAVPLTTAAPVADAVVVEKIPPAN